MHFRNLKIDRPLAILDLETTGLDVRADRIVEISVARFEPNGELNHRTRRLNPTIPIPPAASGVHGIFDKDVATLPTFQQVSKSLLALLDGCDLGGFAIKKFDLPLLEAEFVRVGLILNVEGRRIIDAQEIYHAREGRHLTNAVRFYCGRDHDGAHGALKDVLATAEVLDGQLDRYDDLPRDIEGLYQAFHDPTLTDISGMLRYVGEPGLPLEKFVAFAKGKHDGRTLADVAVSDRRYLIWMVEKGTFTNGVKRLVQTALDATAAEINREALTDLRNNAGTIAAWDFNTALGDTIKEKYKSLYGDLQWHEPETRGGRDEHDQQIG